MVDDMHFWHGPIWQVQHQKVASFSVTTPNVSSLVS